MTATGSDLGRGEEFEVIVTRDRRDPARFHYQTARIRALHPDGLELLGDLTTPECTQAVAQQIGLAWVRLMQPQPVPGGAVRFVWGVAEPDGPAPGTAGGEVRYATVRRPRLFGRGRNAPG